jgi:hypothetical protein
MERMTALDVSLKDTNSRKRKKEWGIIEEGFRVSESRHIHARDMVAMEHQ